MNPLSDLERLVAAIEKQGANIAPTYQEYMPIAFAIANDCGEAGRTFFHRICRMSEKYVSTEADKLYDHALKGGNGRNGLGSVFHLADLAGVKLDKSMAEAGKLSNFQTFTPPSHTHTCTHEEQSVKNVPPAFPEYPWPAFLKRMIDRGDTPRPKGYPPAGRYHRVGSDTQQIDPDIVRAKILLPLPANVHRRPSRLGKGSPRLDTPACRADT